MISELTITKVVSINILNLFTSLPQKGKYIPPVRESRLASFYFGGTNYPVWKSKRHKNKIDKNISLLKHVSTTNLQPQFLNLSSYPFTKFYTTEKTKDFTSINHKKKYVVKCATIPESAQNTAFLLYSSENCIYKNNINIQGTKVDNTNWLTG